MKKFVIEEQGNIYEVLLYSENPLLINELAKKLKKENIILKVKKINNKVYEKYESIDKHNKLAKVIVDLTGYSFKFEKIDNIADPNDNDFIYILKKTQKSNSKISLGNINNVVLVDKITKTSATKIADFIISVLAGKSQKFIDLSKKRNILFYKKYKYQILFSFLFLVVFMPYILNIYPVLSNDIFDRVILQKVSLIKTKKICSCDGAIIKYIKMIISNYTKTPYVSEFFIKPLAYSSRSYTESMYMCDLISYFDKINSSMLAPVFDRTVTTETSFNTLTLKPQDFSRDFDLHPRFNKLFRNYNKDLFLFYSLYDHIDKNFYSPQKKYFLLLFQNSSVLTPTGGTVEEIIVITTDGGKLSFGDKIDASKMNQLFKGRVGNFIYPNTPFINDDYDKSLNLQDKYRILKKMFSESLNINISGMVSVEQRVLDKFADTRSQLVDKDVSLIKSLESYKSILSLFKSGNINFIFEQGDGLIESKDVLRGEYQIAKECNFDIKIIQEKEKNSENAATKVKVVGNQNGTVLSLAFSVSDSDVGANDLFLIKIPEGGLFSIVDRKNVSSYKLGKEEYLSLNNYKTNNMGDIEFIKSIGVCKNGFNIVFEKQPGNSSVQIYYDYTTDSEYNMYFDGALTGRGNKFYNTQSFNLLHDTVFFFVK